MKIYIVVVAYTKHLSKLRVGIRVGRNMAYISIPHYIDVCSGRGDAHEVRVLGKSQRYSPLNLVGELSRYQNH